MSYEPPTPPAGLPAELVDTLNEASPEQLRDVARYAEGLAEHKEREARLEGEPDENDIEERPDDLPDDVPSKATITIKEINDNRYYYWQWREERRSAPSTKVRSTRTNRMTESGTIDFYQYSPCSKCKSIAGSRKTGRPNQFYIDDEEWNPQVTLRFRVSDRQLTRRWSG